MPLDGARWQIDILAADKTAAAFASATSRMKAFDQSAKQMTGGSTSALTAALSSLSALRKSLNEQVEAGKSAEGLGSLLPLLTRLGPIAAAAGAAWLAFKAGMKVGELKDQAEQLGLTTDQLQAYRLAAVTDGVSAEQLDAAFIHLARSMGEAKAGNDQTIALFERLGVKLLDAKGNLRSVADVMPEVARGLLNVGAQSQRSSDEMTLLGKSGSRVETMLRDVAQGNDALTASAKAKGGMASQDTIDVWKELGDQLEIAKTRGETMLATFGKPVAMTALIGLNVQLSIAQQAMKAIQAGANWLTGAGQGSMTRQLSMQIDAANDDIVAFIQRGYSNSDPALQDLIKRRDALTAQLQQQPVVMPDITVTADKPGGVSNPVGKASGSAGENLDVRLKTLQAEHKALDTALAAFEVKGTETVEEVDKRLNAQIEATKKITEATKGAPQGSPIFNQLKTEAQAVVDGNLALDQRKRLLTEAQQTNQTYGDGTTTLTRTMAQLDQQLAANAISQGTYDRAVKAVTQSTDDQERTARGAAGGFDALMAGVEQSAADWARANQAFDAGKTVFQSLDQALDQLSQGSTVNFGKIATQFALMLVKMEVAAAGSTLWKSLGGFQGIASAIGGLFGSSAGTGAGGSQDASYGGSLTFGGPRAAGGPVDAGSMYLVGEHGPEPFVPGSSGSILPNSALGGGKVTVNVINNHNGAQVATRSRGTPGGGQQIDVMIEQLETALARRADRNTGSLSAFLNSRYGSGIPRRGG